jgi:hypothetical protein
VRRTPVLFFVAALAITAFASDCQRPLDADTLNQVQLGWQADVQLQPGGTHQFQLAILSTFAASTTVTACVEWSVEPSGKGAIIDSAGVLHLDLGTPPRTRFTVSANIEKGRARREAIVIVYTAQTQPLVGLWEQTAQYDCDSGKLMEYFKPIRELEFRAAGRFSVTWTPFEVYRDYWGEYLSDPETKMLKLKIAGGNFVPPDFQGSGTYVVINESLELHTIFLGTRETGTTQRAVRPPGNLCRYVFKLHARPS